MTDHRPPEQNGPNYSETWDERMGAEQRTSNPKLWRTLEEMQADAASEQAMERFDNRYFTDRCERDRRDLLAEIERLTRELAQAQDTIQRYSEHHEHCTITTYHGVREVSERGRLLAALELAKPWLVWGPDSPGPQWELNGVLAEISHALSGEPSSAVETKHAQAPILRARVKGGLVVSSIFYAPGLPDGEFDFYCEPEAVAPMMRAAEKASECQHSRFEPGCTLKPCHPSATHANVWEYRCGVCQQQFSLAIGEAQLSQNG